MFSSSDSIIVLFKYRRSGPASPEACAADTPKKKAAFPSGEAACQQKYDITVRSTRNCARQGMMVMMMDRYALHIANK